ncbi:hypothetical protein QFZ21_004240 [Microbacterium sp. W4I20]|nr:hypothetical protein [Microbacterium sp. W4I20]
MVSHDREPGECYAEEARDFLDGIVYGNTKSDEVIHIPTGHAVIIPGNALQES